MSDELDKIDNEETPVEKESADFNKRRKLLLGAVSVTPILMSVAARPVNAVQGLSNMQSGDASDCRGDDFWGGQSPGFYKKIVGSSDHGHECYEVWNSTGYYYQGTLSTGKLLISNSSAEYDSYFFGSLYDDVFSGVQGDSFPGKTLREVLNEDENTDSFHYIAALLNASYSKNAVLSPAYFLTVLQFWGLYDGSIPLPPGYDTLKQLIEGLDGNRYHDMPGSDCRVKKGKGHLK